MSIAHHVRNDITQGFSNLYDVPYECYKLLVYQSEVSRTCKQLERLKSTKLIKCNGKQYLKTVSIRKSPSLQDVMLYNLQINSLEKISTS